MPHTPAPAFDKPHLDEFINELAVMLIWVDAELRVTKLNIMANHILGCKQSPIGQSLFELFPALADYRASLVETLLKQKKLSLSQQMLDYGDRTHPCYVTVYPLLSGPEALIKIEDLSHQTLLDDMVIQSEKMVTIGGLASGMAHEVKNPLGIILQNIQNILHRLDKTAEKNIVVAQELKVSLDEINRYLEARNILKFMDNIRIAIDRALQIIATMLNFGTQNPIHMKNENVLELIENALSFVEQDYDLLHSFDISRVKVNRDFPIYPIPPIVCSGTQLTQVFFNLIKNAIQALHHIPQSEITLRVIDQPDAVIISVSDNGQGIPPHLLTNLFKPFFTTKSREQGTGLGLAVSHYIISENHHGTLTADNLPEGGACFTAVIPRHPC